MRFFTAVGTCLLALSSVVSAASFTNPLKASDGSLSDPHIAYTGGYYYMMTTTWSNLQINRAKTLGGLKSGEKKTVWTDSNANRCCNMWAPELHYFDGIWYIYYTAGRSGSDNLDLQRPYVLKGGANPFATYTYHAQLTTIWGIDGSSVRFATWGNYFVWSCMADSLQSICIAPFTLPGKLCATKVLSKPTQSWEKHGSPVMQSPTAIGDPSLEGSWKKTGPYLTSANGNYGPGHNGFFNSPDGTEIWNVYHATANSAGACDGNRYTMAQKVNWNSDGSPNCGSPAKLGTTIAGPSGE
ncbi:Arabinanase/levansucrase/invertase [Setomelanomma holmii]|uniref:Arabinanase/levansucrase/invertase n=1 Tax=Setomelanomma holmii TaxID=210430 RepID=A0A9P4H6M5_9PLEO|nr:Arabinanase/levansucrase/invertase [Setomelanomma holmii]